MRSFASGSPGREAGLFAELSLNSGDVGFLDLFVDEILFSLEVGVFLRLAPEDEDWHDEAEQADQGVDETHKLPENVVASIGAAEIVKGDVGLEVPHHELEEGPWDEVLNGEAPPEDEDLVPPRLGSSAEFVVALGHFFGKFVGSVKEDLFVPVSDASLWSFEHEREEDCKKGEHPEDEDAEPHQATWHSEDGDGAHDEESTPVQYG